VSNLDRMSREEFEAACAVKHDAFAEWIEAMNGPVPAVKVERVHVPGVVCELRRPAPKDFPAHWRAA